MDSYSYILSNSSSHHEYYSYSSTSQEFPNNQYHQQQEIMTRREPPPPPAHRAALHSVRKLPGKKFITKKLPIAPLPRTPPKLYKVDQVHFKDVVQKLTGAAPELRRITRLQEVAPPPLRLHPPPAFFHPNSQPSNCGAVISPIDFSLSPSSLAWCWSLLMSPETAVA